MPLSENKVLPFKHHVFEVVKDFKRKRFTIEDVKRALISRGVDVSNKHYLSVIIAQHIVGIEIVAKIGTPGIAGALNVYKASKKLQPSIYREPRKVRR